MIKQQKSKAGTNIPPSAATTGSMEFLKEDNSPSNNSLFISMPAKKKNIAIKKSLMINNGELGKERKINGYDDCLFRQNVAAINVDSFRRCRSYY